MAAICDNCKKEGEDRPPCDSNNCEMISLEIAAADGHPECLRTVINAGADVNYINKGNGYTPVMWAARYGHPECMELLINKGADVNKTECDDSALMFVSAYKENIRCVKLLLKAGADVNQKDHQGMTALMCAVRCGHPDIAKLLIKAGADVNATDKAGIAVLTCCATSTTGWKCVDLLVEEGADVNIKSYGKTALMWAVENGYEECIEALLKAGADVNMREYNCTALQMAAYRRDDKCFEMLLNAGANVNDKNGNDVLMSCVASNNYERVERMIAAGVDVNFEWQYGSLSTALFLAAVGNSPEIIRLLLRNGIKINRLNEGGNNVLETYLSYCNTVTQEVSMLLFAAGECVTKILWASSAWNKKVQVIIPDYLKQNEEKLDLKHLCRMIIRKHLLDLDPHSPLFARISNLGLPAVVNGYLLFNMSIDKNEDVASGSVQNNCMS